MYVYTRRGSLVSRIDAAIIHSAQPGQERLCGGGFRFAFPATPWEMKRCTSHSLAVPGFAPAMTDAFGVAPGLAR